MLQQKSDECQNCGTKVIGNYCHTCGQDQEAKKVSLKLFIKRAVSEYISLDNRLLTTLKELLFKPGFLTNAWLQGKRSQYVPPFRLYLLISLIYFAILSFTEVSTFFGGILKISIDQRELYRSWLPRIMFLIMPLFALFVSLVHYKLKKFYVEHLIFSIHFYSFLFIVSIVQTLFRDFSGNAFNRISQIPVWLIVVDLLLQILPIVFLGVSLKKVYQQKTWIVVIKTLTLLVFFAGILALSAAMIESVS